MGSEQQSSTNSAGVNVTSVACNHCGAPLEVGPSTRFVTCGYCGAKLEVHRTGSSLYTEVLQSIDQRTQQMAQDLDYIKRQSEIDRLDRDWAMRRDRLLVRGKNGQVSEPSAIGSIIGSVIAVAFGIFWVGGAASAGAPGFMVLFGAVFVIGAIAMGIAGVGKAAEYRDAQRSYEQQRRTILNRGNPNNPYS